jgi:hypothetical protein
MALAAMSSTPAAAMVSAADRARRQQGDRREPGRRQRPEAGVVAGLGQQHEHEAEGDAADDSEGEVRARWRPTRGLVAIEEVVVGAADQADGHQGEGDAGQRHRPRTLATAHAPQHRHQRRPHGRDRRHHAHPPRGQAPVEADEADGTEHP